MVGNRGATRSIVRLLYGEPTLSAYGSPEFNMENETSPPGLEDEIIVKEVQEIKPFSIMNGRWNDSLVDFRPVPIPASEPDPDYTLDDERDEENEFETNPKDSSVVEPVVFSTSETATQDNDSEQSKELSVSAAKVSIPPKVQRSGKQTS